ncbi:glycoside hydrolase family 2 protein [Shimia biformata]|uniref:glycoside hydrolase family 2 protein n=1 Tax=Shimia biformata TaxID=1294299 RepID=UPI00195113B9
MTVSSTTLPLSDGWTLSLVGSDIVAPFPVPGDVHSALLAEGLIPDPYWRDTEPDLDWVHQSEWLAETRFNVGPLAGGRYVLTLTSVDTHATIRLNGQEIGRCENQFLRYDFDVSDALIDGENLLQVHFLSNSRIAAEKAAASDIPIPYIAQNNRLAHYNFLRKTQCHAGWDWNIALSPIGIYGDVTLRRCDPLRLDDVVVRQDHGQDGSVTVSVELFFDANAATTAEAEIEIDGQTIRAGKQVWPGQNRITLSARIDDPVLWWPAGAGGQHRYDLGIRLGNEARHVKLGLRDVALDTSPDEVGNRFAFRVNGRDIFMRGANWIPADALPQRATPEATRDLLQSAVDANMNMIRVWGGGQYEADWFYELCDELGLMVWQDFMFACNSYPAHQRDWLDLVRREARQQIRRLSRFACLALWCGDNELVGALGWFDETRANRDRYLAIYDRLNHALEEAIEDEAPGVPFWPSSPSVGRLDFGDGWHVDTSGDMHFWDVWHSAREFEHYRSVRPRFASEFGFQSFPSMQVIEGFTDPADRNVSSRVMEVHQRNAGGNARIVETLQRYFRFPDRFDDMVYLSQVSQGLAMKTAIEFWRANAPRCMGTLFWQLNDTWPVASWSSLEYGGAWKCTHYLARRFLAPVLVTAQPDDATGEVVLFGVNDTADTVTLNITTRAVHVSGVIDALVPANAALPPGRATEVMRLAPGTLADDAFLHFDWTDKTGVHVGENEYLPKRPKDYDLGQPKIDVSRDGDQITLTSDRPALFVTHDHGGRAVYDDNCLTLMPGRSRTIRVLRHRGADPSRNPAPIQVLKG